MRKHYPFVINNIRDFIFTQWSNKLHDNNWIIWIETMLYYYISLPPYRIASKTPNVTVHWARKHWNMNINKKNSPKTDIHKFLFSVYFQKSNICICKQIIGCRTSNILLHTKPEWMKLKRGNNKWNFSKRKGKEKVKEEKTNHKLQNYFSLKKIETKIRVSSPQHSAVLGRTPRHPTHRRSPLKKFLHNVNIYLVQINWTHICSYSFPLINCE